MEDLVGINSDSKSLESKNTVKPDLIFFPGTEWTPFAQRAQSLAIEFSRRGHRIFYVEPMLSIGKLLKYVFKGRTLKLPQIRHKNIYLLRPCLSFSHFRGSWTQKIDKRMFDLWFTKVRKRYSIEEYAAVYICMPYWWGHIIDRSTFPENKILYDCIDDCQVYSRNSRILKVMERSEDRLAREANFVLSTARPLYERMKKFNNSTYLLSNGADTIHFVKSTYTMPDDIKNLKRPIFGFVGALYHWIDFSIFERLASSNQNGSIVLIGPTNTREIGYLIRRYKNIHYLGAKPYEQVPDYIYAFDICISPFKKSRIGDYVNPLKLYDYLILGKPVISSRTKEMENFSEYVYLYDDYEEIDRIVRIALSEEQDSSKRKKRIRFARANSWETKVTEIINILSLDN